VSPDVRHSTGSSKDPEQCMAMVPVQNLSNGSLMRKGGGAVEVRYGFRLSALAGSVPFCRLDFA